MTVFDGLHQLQDSYMIHVGHIFLLLDTYDESATNLVCRQADIVTKHIIKPN